MFKINIAILLDSYLDTSTVSLLYQKYEKHKMICQQLIISSEDLFIQRSLWMITDDKCHV